MTKFDDKLLQEIPERLSEIELLNFLKTKKVGINYMLIFRKYTNLKDEIISAYLNINIENINSKKSKIIFLSKNTQEHLIMLLWLFKRGTEVLGTKENFSHWLKTKNFYLDNDAPINYLNTISGIRLIEARLTGMEFGDNI